MESRLNLKNQIYPAFFVRFITSKYWMKILPMKCTQIKNKHPCAKELFYDFWMNICTKERYFKGFFVEIVN